MVGSRQSGFTVIEVMLFLGISGMLFLIALLGTGATIRSVRFTDSGRSLEAYVQKQYDDIVNGLNQRDSNITCTNGTVDTTTPQTVGTSNCFFMGKLLVFRQGNSTVTSYNVVGTAPAGVDYSQSDESLVIAFKPQALTQTSVSTYNLPWQAYASGFKRLSDNVATNGLLLVRSPKSTRILSYTVAVPATVPNDLTSIVTNTTTNLGTTANYCIMNADNLGPPAKLVVIGTISNQTAASIVFDANAGDCNGQ